MPLPMPLHARSDEAPGSAASPIPRTPSSSLLRPIVIHAEENSEPEDATQAAARAPADETNPSGRAPPSAHPATVMSPPLGRSAGSASPLLPSHVRAGSGGVRPVLRAATGSDPSNDNKNRGGTAAFGADRHVGRRYEPGVPGMSKLSPAMQHRLVLSVPPVASSAAAFGSGGSRPVALPTLMADPHHETENSVRVSINDSKHSNKQSVDGFATSDSGESTASEYGFCGNSSRIGARQLLPALIIALFIVGAIVLAVLLHRSLQRSELDRFLDRQASLCMERAQAFKGTVGQALLSMQGAAGFGRLAQQMTTAGARGLPLAPVGAGAHRFNFLPNATFASDEAEAFASADFATPLLRQTDFVDFFRYSASSRFLQQVVWMPKVFNGSEREAFESNYGITIHNVNLQFFNDSAPKPQPFWSRQADKSVYFPWLYAYFTNPRGPEFIGVDYSVIPSLAADQDECVSEGNAKFSFRAPSPLEVKPENIDEFGTKNFNIYVFLPVYATPSVEASTADSTELLSGVSLVNVEGAEARLSDAIGVVLGEIRAFTSLKSVLQTMDTYPMVLELYDLDAAKPEEAFIARVNALNGTVAEHTAAQPFSLSGRNYELRCIPTGAWIESGYSSAPLIISVGAAGIVVINLVLIMALGLLWGWHRAVVKSKELEEANHKRAEAVATLQHAQNVSDAANQSKSEFLGFLCHELRNPLHAIGSMMEFLHGSESLQLCAEHEDLECLDVIDSQVKLMNLLVNDALDLSKIEAGKMTFERIGFSLAKLVRATAAGLKARAYAQGIALRTVIAPDLPKWCYGDPTRLRQVLTNMLSNAIKFTNVGEVIVSVSSFPVCEWEGPLPDVSQLRWANGSLNGSEDAQSRTSSQEQKDGTSHASNNKNPLTNPLPPNMPVVAPVSGGAAGGGGGSASKRSKSAEHKTPTGRGDGGGVKTPNGGGAGNTRDKHNFPLVPIQLQPTAQSQSGNAVGSGAADASTPNDGIVDGHGSQSKRQLMPQLAQPLHGNLNGVVVQSSPHAERSPFVGFEIRVSDTGCGISEENLPLLFQPFAQATLSVARKFGGTGLGLSIVKQIIELMGGSIQVTSALYVGTTFIVRFLLPVERSSRRGGDGGGSSGGTSGESTGASTGPSDTRTSDESSHKNSPLITTKSLAHGVAAASGSPKEPLEFPAHPQGTDAALVSSRHGASKGAAAMVSMSLAAPAGGPSGVSRRPPPRSSNPHSGPPHLTPFTRNRALIRTSEEGDDGDDADDDQDGDGDGNGNGGRDRGRNPNVAANNTSMRQEANEAPAQQLVELATRDSSTAPVSFGDIELMTPTGRVQQAARDAALSSYAESLLSSPTLASGGPGGGADSSALHPPTPFDHSSSSLLAGGPHAHLTMSGQGGISSPSVERPPATNEPLPLPLPTHTSNGSGSSIVAPPASSSVALESPSDSTAGDTMTQPKAEKESNSRSSSQRDPLLQHHSSDSHAGGSILESTAAGHAHSTPSSENMGRTLAYSGSGAYVSASVGGGGAASSAVSSPISAPPPLAKLSVLVVDDSQTNIKILCKMLGVEGFTCTTALDGQQALDIVTARANAEGEWATATSRQFDIIFSDIQMPVMDGLQLAAAVRSLEARQSLPRVPLVALTANAMEHDRLACFSAGFTSFLAKPFGRVLLKPILREIRGSDPEGDAAEAKIKEIKRQQRKAQKQQATNIRAGPLQ